MNPACPANSRGSIGGGIKLGARRTVTELHVLELARGNVLHKVMREDAPGVVKNNVFRRSPEKIDKIFA